MPCKCICELDFNVLTMINEGLQRLIIDALMINVTCTDSQESKWENLYTNTQFCRIKGCGGAGCPPPPPPIIFERLKLPQQIIYRRKENLSESPNHQKYWENILVSRFYGQFSRNRRNLGHFRKFEKISNS